MRRHCTLVAGLLVAGLLAGCGGHRSDPPAGTTPSPAPPSSAAPAGEAVPVYYVMGARLYREFHSVRADPDPGTAAVRELLARDTGDDPDYRSAWPAGWTLRAPVQHAAKVITVDLSPPAAGGGANPTAELARLGAQQLVYTVQGALGSTDPVRILLDGRRAEKLWGQVPISAPVERADPHAVRAPVQIDNPANGLVVGRTVRVSGEAATFEANVTWQVLEGDTVVRHGAATAGEAFTLTPYSFTVTLEPGVYTVRVAEEDVSDGEGRPPFSDTKTITVR
ncbi:Gmad2 immunoglobulin-like domain-containing protein [Pseudonocardia acaciae]|uniref:Gmad2 immunoglobulin-like domain-containing protein n=1 Tax=Pseudonocardia acaciae TaxID=551276 RepID=UPI00048BBDA0|nr:Gmad2 immunoglobulin-like domain-containing protein [Pseudonocardia acaciae]